MTYANQGPYDAPRFIHVADWFIEQGFSGIGEGLRDAEGLVARGEVSEALGVLYGAGLALNGAWRDCDDPAEDQEVYHDAAALLDVAREAVLDRRPMVVFL